MSGFGGLLRGLTTAATGAEQGLANRAELERQARLQLLAQRLQDAQLEHLNAETTKLQQPVAPKNIDPNSPQGIAAALAKHPPKPVTPKAPGRPIVTYKPDGTAVFLDPNTLQPRTPGDPNVGRPATSQQLGMGQQSSTADDAVTHMERIANADEDAFRTAVAFIRAKRHGRLGDLVSESRGELSDKNAQQIVEDYYNYMLNISPTYGGTRPTKILMDLETEAGVPPIGSDKSTWPRIFQRFHDQVRTLRARAGRGAGPDASAPPARFQ